MNISIKLLIIILLSLIMGINFINQKTTPIRKHVSSEFDLEVNIKKDEVGNNYKKIKNNYLELSSDEQYILDVMKPVELEVLKDNWNIEFGCYYLNPSSEARSSDSCDDMYLTAKSFDEAQWMQRNGYPSNSSLKLLNDKDNIKIIEKLARVNKNTAAMILIAINDMKNNNSKDAFIMAMSIRAYSKPNLTFPHRLAGQAFMGNNNIEWGLKSLKIASLLGDYESQYQFNRYILKYPHIIINVTDRAHYYIGNIFGSQYPVDPRPKSHK